MTNRQYKTHSPLQTRQLAARMAADARAGDIFCLTGDLAAGKTEFVKGFADGLGTPDPVTSPTFTIVNEYHGGRLPIYHFDVYRISTPEQMQDTGYEEYFYGDGVCVIEWADLIRPLIPDDAVIVELSGVPGEGCEDCRLICVHQTQADDAHTGE